MGATKFLCALLLAAGAFACDLHDTGKLVKGKRQDAASGPPKKLYDYAASWNWANLDPDAFGVCQNGTQQSPIPLSLNNGLSRNHIPTFNYPTSVQGNFKNWGFGPAFDVVYEAGNLTSNPSISFDNETNYLVGWHIHTPADHTINGFRAHAELHLVHQDASGVERAIVAILIEPGNEVDAFITQLPQPHIKFNAEDPSFSTPLTVDLNAALASAANLKEFWTYEGSLTSPPCTEGKRFFVARQTMYVSVDQMRMIMDASTYSARAEQLVWQHRINE